MELPSVKSVFLVVCLVLAASASSLKRVKRAHRQPTGPGRTYHMALACERKTVDLTCGRGLVINIVRVMYGRLTLTQCTEDGISTKGWNTQCAASSRRSHGWVSFNCNGRSSCTIQASNHWFGDPCPRTYKYLEVYYACAGGAFNNLPRQS